ncbi:hypothetical protein PMA4326_009960 [Pseudomonas syringae pv. maculicola str. ES4326]|uniref:Uncharacterized protein n=1 Tax=Pseudomonas syringae pv. maculicola str. ES4326 TaxID=629265 RepID=A0A8T8C0U1_PSEYM|nr:hypothetical protein PMA4326_009960 [Pseudomonas syringae pv. maculicola str. ES4326]
MPVSAIPPKEYRKQAVALLIDHRLCTKSRRAKVRQGKNRQGSGVYGL